ncbi:MAG: CDP-alcohol phosphatidyltransferase family protein [Gammaproteobacteria bacterium]|nr:CDP-alcohol phosphatidyltransferase family protein [Gammaproteobacteria bacterium]
MKTSRTSELFNIPNILSCLRMGLGPLLLHIAWQGHHEPFVIVLIIAFLLDLIDGPIARYTNQVTELGPKLDSWADFVVYMTLPIGAWWLWPEIILREKIYVGLAVASVIVPTVVGFIRFRQPTSYHTWLTKFAVVCMAPSVIILLLEGPAWPFQISAIIALLAGLEETTITVISKKADMDVKSLFHIK